MNLRSYPQFQNEDRSYVKSVPKQPGGGNIRGGGPRGQGYNLLDSFAVRSADFTRFWSWPERWVVCWRATHHTCNICTMNYYSCALRWKDASGDKHRVPTVSSGSGLMGMPGDFTSQVTSCNNMSLLFSWKGFWSLLITLKFRKIVNFWEKLNVR